MADWGKISSRGNVEDRRSMGPAVVGGISITGVILYMLVNYLTNGQVNIPLDELESIPVDQQQSQNTEIFDGEDDYEVFASTVLGSNNDMWVNILKNENKS